MVRLVTLRILESYFRHRWLYLLPIVMMIGVSVVYFLTQAEAYISSGVLYVQRETLVSSLNDIGSDSSVWLDPSEIASQELDDLLQTDVFIRAIIRQTSLEDSMSLSTTDSEQAIKDARDAVWVRILGRNQIRVFASHENAQVTYELVEATIEVHRQWQINAALSESATATSFFDTLIVSYGEDLVLTRAALQTYLEAHPEPVRGDRPVTELIEIDRLQSDVSIAESRYNNALEKEENARLVAAQVESDLLQRYFVLDAPTVPLEPETSLRKTATNMVVITLGGALISVGAIIGGALLDRSFRFPIDVEHGLDLPVLATVSDTASKSKKSRFRRRQESSEDQAVLELQQAGA